MTKKIQVRCVSCNDKIEDEETIDIIRTDDNSLYGSFCGNCIEKVRVLWWDEYQKGFNEGFAKGKEGIYCPIWQCGGTLSAIEPNEQKLDSDDWQFMELQCNNFKEHRFILKERIVQEIKANLEKIARKNDIGISFPFFAYKDWENFWKEQK